MKGFYSILLVGLVSALALAADTDHGKEQMVSVFMRKYDLYH